MSDKTGKIFALVMTTVALSGCLAPLVPSEDRDAACKFAPASDICATGRAWRWDPNRAAARQLRIQHAERDAAEKEAAERAARDKIYLAEQQEKAEKAHQRKLNAPRYVNRRTETFASYQDAAEALDVPDNSATLWFARDPFSLKDKPGGLLLEIVQVLEDGGLLVNPCFSLPGTCPAIAHFSAGYGGRREFVDGQRLYTVAEVTGTAQYTSVLGANKTVPELRVYGVQLAGNAGP